MTQNYLKTFSPQFLVKGEGGHPWHSLPNAGHVLATTYILALIGIGDSIMNVCVAVRERLFDKESSARLLLLYLIGISLLPAAITVDAPHATRSLLFFFLFTVFAAVGCRALYLWLPKHLAKNALKLLICITALLFGGYLWQYFSTYPTQQKIIKAGFDQVVQRVNEQHPQEPIAIVDQEGFHYILLAWYLKIPPQRYFDTIVRQQPDRIGFRYGEQLDRYHFIFKDTDRRFNENIVIEWSTMLKPQEWSVVEY